MAWDVLAATLGGSRLSSWGPEGRDSIFVRAGRAMRLLSRAELVGRLNEAIEVHSAGLDLGVGGTLWALLLREDEPEAVGLLGAILDRVRPSELSAALIWFPSRHCQELGARTLNGHAAVAGPRAAAYLRER